MVLYDPNLEVPIHPPSTNQNYLSDQYQNSHAVVLNGRGNLLNDGRVTYCTREFLYNFKFTDVHLRSIAEEKTQFFVEGETMVGLGNLCSYNEELAVNYWKLSF